MICGKFYHNGKIKQQLDGLAAKIETTEWTFPIPFNEIYLIGTIFGYQKTCNT